MSAPPNSLESEQAIIASCMYQGAEVIEQVSALLTPESFYAPAHRHTFHALQLLSEQGQPTEPTRVFEQLKHMGRDKEVGGATALSRLMQVTPAIAYPMQHAAIVANYYRQRQALQLGHRMVALLNEPAEDSTEQILSLSEQLSDIALDRRTNEMRSLDELMPHVLAYVKEAYDNRGPVKGVPSGITELDRITTGRHPGDVTVVASRPGMGKTSLVLNWALYEAKHGYVVPFFSLEMPSLQLGLRLLSIEARVNVQKLRTGEITADKWPKITEAIAALRQLPIYIDDSSSMSFGEIRRKLQLLRRRQERKTGKPIKFGGVKIDYLQLMRPNEKRYNREEEVAELSRDSKLLAKSLVIPVDLVSQLNRAPESRKDPRPTLGDLRNSGAIEQDADNIVFVYRDEYYHKDETVDKGVAELIVAKQRNGPTGTVRCRWTGAYARFDNLATEPEYDELGAGIDDRFPGGI